MSVYLSKVDWWLIAIIAGSVILTVVLGISMYNQTKTGSFICFVTALFTAGVFLLLAVPCKYTLTEDRVLIQSGILKQEALYSQITGVKKSNNPLSAPALSLQRVEITMKNGFKLVSPKNREQFIQELTSRLKAAS